MAVGMGLVVRYLFRDPYYCHIGVKMVVVLLLSLYIKTQKKLNSSLKERHTPRRALCHCRLQDSDPRIVNSKTDTSESARSKSSSSRTNLTPWYLAGNQLASRVFRCLRLLLMFSNPSRSFPWSTWRALQTRPNLTSRHFKCR